MISGFTDDINTMLDMLEFWSGQYADYEGLSELYGTHFDSSEIDYLLYKTRGEFDKDKVMKALNWKEMPDLTEFYPETPDWEGK